MMRIATAPTSSMIPPRTSKYLSKTIFLSPLFSHYASENFGMLAVNFDDDSDADEVEQLFEIGGAHADAAVGCGFADGLWSVGPMNSVALRAEAHPAGAEGIS